ncbi:DMT family transporter [Desmospora profundinema]|nr:EamA family transporter [Desmospora profundinema]
MVVIGAVMWGLSGTVAQTLFQEADFQPGWLVSVRLLTAGVLLLAILAVRRGAGTILAVWREPRDRLQLLVFGIGGMLAVQYTYFAAIDASNAAMATLLQYLGPMLICCWLAFRSRRWPTSYEGGGVLLALAGTALLVSGGHGGSLSVSGTALFWGLASAVALAFYTLYPSRLLPRWGAGTVVGWAMVIGGTGLSFLHPPWQVTGTFTLESILSISFIIVFGTLLAFFLYLDSLRLIRPTETSLLACTEPLSATVAAVVWLGVPFGVPEWVGAGCIIATVALLSLEPHTQQKAVEPASIPHAKEKTG